MMNTASQAAHAAHPWGPKHCAARFAPRATTHVAPPRGTSPGRRPARAGRPAGARGQPRRLTLTRQALVDSLGAERAPPAASDGAAPPARLAELQAAVQALERENAALRGGPGLGL
jgi:hypothetical protein